MGLINKLFGPPKVKSKPFDSLDLVARFEREKEENAKKVIVDPKIRDFFSDNWTKFTWKGHRTNPDHPMNGSLYLNLDDRVVLTRNAKDGQCCLYRSLEDFLRDRINISTLRIECIDDTSGQLTTMGGVPCLTYNVIDRQ